LNIVLLITSLFACSSDPNRATLSEDVGATFASCIESEIRYLVTKHNLMTSFAPCGNNLFEAFSWSPNGKSLYFQLSMTGYIMDAESPNKAVKSVPTASPIGPATWLANERLVLPVSPEQGKTTPRLAIVEWTTPSVHHLNLTGFQRVETILTSPNAEEVWVLGDLEDQQGVLLAVSLLDGSQRPAFSWLKPGIDTVTYDRTQDWLAVGRGQEVTLFARTSGETLGRFAPATRGIVHHGGVWLALEHEGEPISVFHQRAWDEVSERAREREVARTKRFEEQLPDHFDREVKPPVISFAHLPTGRRWQLDSVQGWDFQWYEPTDHYASFMLWGFEHKQFKRNVLLGNMTDRLKSVSEGKEFLGVRAFEGGVTSVVSRPDQPPQQDTP
jgi:hypothetical protein